MQLIRLPLAILKQKLMTEIVNFQYQKIDGTVRPAVGTLVTDLIPADQRPRGRRPAYQNVMTYYDLERAAWRCFRLNNYQGILYETNDSAR
jgi:hypothetical protein